MKKKTRNRIEIIILLSIAILGGFKACKADAEYENRLQEADTIKYEMLDGELIAIPVE
jgi:hypothetical protein